MKSTSTAIWNGTLKEGSGEMTGQSGYFKHLPYTFKTRFENGKEGSTPEELIAAAHAGCYSMALSAELEKAGYIAESIQTSSTVTIDNGTITTSELTTKAKIPGISREKFEEIAEATKSACPVSKVLNLEILLKPILL